MVANAGRDIVVEESARLESDKSSGKGASGCERVLTSELRFEGGNRGAGGADCVSAIEFRSEDGDRSSAGDSGMVSAGDSAGDSADGSGDGSAVDCADGPVSGSASGSASGGEGAAITEFRFE
jgi:hypothetical protein